MKLISFLLTTLLAGCAGFPALPDPTPENTTYAVENSDGANGSAVEIAPGLLLTAGHVAVVPNMFINYKGVKLLVEPVKIDEERDIALIKVLGMQCPCMPITAVNVRGTSVEAYGFPVKSIIGIGVKTSGVIQGITSSNFLLSTAQIAPGNSGGGLFSHDIDGYRLEGITVNIINIPVGFSSSLIPYLAQSVSAETIKNFLESI